MKTLLPGVLLLSSMVLAQGAVGGLGDLKLSSLKSTCHLRAVPRAGFQEVALSCEGQKDTPVSGLPTLEGAVNIDSAEEALEFVRLFTTELRWTYSGVSDYAEARPAKKRFEYGFLVTQKTFDSCCEGPEVKVLGSDPVIYQVTRTLVNSDYRVVRLTETVGANGRWRIVKERPTSVDGRKLGRWLLGPTGLAVPLHEPL